MIVWEGRLRSKREEEEKKKRDRRGGKVIMVGWITT